MKEGRNSFVRRRCQKFIIASLDSLRSVGLLTTAHIWWRHNPSLECEGCYKWMTGNYQIKTLLMNVPGWHERSLSFCLEQAVAMPQIPVIPYKKRIRKASSPSHSLISKFLVTPSQTTFKSPFAAAIAADVSTFTVVNLNSREEGEEERRMGGRMAE